MVIQLLIDGLKEFLYVPVIYRPAKDIIE